MNRSSINESESLRTEEDLEEETKEHSPFRMPKSDKSEHYEINVVKATEDLNV